MNMSSARPTMTAKAGVLPAYAAGVAKVLSASPCFLKQPLPCWDNTDETARHLRFVLLVERHNGRFEHPELPHSRAACRQFASACCFVGERDARLDELWRFEHQLVSYHEVDLTARGAIDDYGAGDGSSSRRRCFSAQFVEHGGFQALARVAACRWGKGREQRGIDRVYFCR